MLKTIFVIHSEKDSDILSSLIMAYEGIRFKETDLYFDCVNIKNYANLGMDVGEDIKERIKNSDVVIAIITHNCKKSIWVNQEIGFALASKDRIIPVMERKVMKKGFGFIHSNIDSQLFNDDKIEFDRLNIEFSNRYGPMMKKPDIIQPQVGL